MANNLKVQPTEALPFCIVAEPRSHFCEFRCYECAGYSADAEGNYTVPEYHIQNYSNGTDLTPDLEKAQVYLHGSIKWDGCANLHFDEQDNVMLHFCGLRDAQKIGLLIERLYSLAAELIPSWDKECAA